MHFMFITRKFAMLALAALTLCGCNRSSVKEAPITGKASDGPASMPARWQEGRRYIYRVETVTASEMPRKNTAKLIQAETMLAQDLAFLVTNVATDGGRVLQMEVLAVQLETGREDGITMSFDSGNKVMQVEDTPLVQRLRRLVGLKLAFRVSPENRVLRVDGMKDLSDRMSGFNSSRSVAGGIVSRYFNQQFFRDIVEMGMLPRDPVKAGDTWKVSRQTSTGSSGGSVPMEFTYKFRGWQRHEGTNCARLDFSAVFTPNAPLQTNDSFVGRVVKAATSPNVQEGSITGKSWYDPGISLAVETFYEQSIITKSTTARRVRTKTDTNNVDVVEIVSSTNAPPPLPATNSPAQTVTTTTTTTQQTTHIKLLEIEPLDK